MTSCHLCERIEVTAHRLKELMLYGFYCVSHRLLAIAHVANHRQGLDEHTHDFLHLVGFTAVVDGRNQHALLTGYAVQYLQEGSHEEVVLRKSVLAAVRLNLALMEREV